MVYTLMEVFRPARLNPGARPRWRIWCAAARPRSRRRSGCGLKPGTSSISYAATSKWRTWCSSRCCAPLMPEVRSGRRACAMTMQPSSAPSNACLRSSRIRRWRRLPCARPRAACWSGSAVRWRRRSATCSGPSSCATTGHARQLLGVGAHHRVHSVTEVSRPAARTCRSEISPDLGEIRFVAFPELLGEVPLLR